MANKETEIKNKDEKRVINHFLWMINVIFFTNNAVML